MNIRDDAFTTRTLNTSLPSYEIWFSCIEVPSLQKAMWIRYSVLRSNNNYLCGVIWFSLFDQLDSKNHLVITQTFQSHEISWRNDSLQIGQSQCSINKWQGHATNRLGRIDWNLQWDHLSPSRSHAPSALSHLPLVKSHSIVVSPFAEVSGSIDTYKGNFEFKKAKGSIEHLWGSKRIYELYWMFCPHFDNDPEGWCVEVVAARPAPWMPMFYMALVKNNEHEIIEQSVWSVLSGNVSAQFPKVEINVKLNDFNIHVTGEINTDQLTPYIYRSPDLSKSFIANSDVSKVILTVQSKATKKVLISKAGAAVEFHGPKPWPSTLDYFDPYLGQE